MTDTSPSEAFARKCKSIAEQSQAEADKMAAYVLAVLERPIDDDWRDMDDRSHMPDDVVAIFTDCNNASVRDAAIFYASRGLQPVKVLPKEKKPFEDGWQKRDYGTREKATAAFSSHNGNIGIRGDDKGLVILDYDVEPFKKIIRREMPELTDTLQSKGKRGTGHDWIRVDKPFDGKSIIRLEEKDATGRRPKHTLMDLRALGGQVVVAPSTHPDGMQYQWLNDNRIINVKTERLMAAIDIACSECGVKNPFKKAQTSEVGNQTNIFKAVKEKVLINDITGSMNERIDCLVHKETTPSRAMKQYFETNSVYCFSCGFSGDVIALYAEMSNLTQFEATRALAAKYGVALNAPSTHSANSNVGEGENAPFALSAPDAARGGFALCTPPLKGSASTPPRGGDRYQVYPFGGIPEELKKKPEFVVEQLVPEGLPTLISSSPKGFKSTIALYMAARIAVGKEIWNGGATKECRVLYVDEEDTFGHLETTIQGLTIDFSEAERAKLNENLLLMSGEGFTFEKLDKLRAAIDEHRPSIIFVDTMRRALKGDESDSQVINELFQDYLKPLSAEYKITWVLLHHNRKQMANFRSDALDPSSMRGSGDLWAMAGSVLMLGRIKVSNEVILCQAANKWGAELPSHRLQIDRDETTGQISIADCGKVAESYGMTVKRAGEIMEWLEIEQKVEIATNDINTKFGKGNATDSAIKMLKEHGKLVGNGKQNRSPFRVVVGASKQANPVTKLPEFD